MIQGETESLRAITATCPGLAPTVLGWSKFDTNPPRGDKDDPEPVFFLIEDFLPLLDDAPPCPTSFALILADLHRSSRSPTGRFGFHVPTCDGPLPHPVSWHDSWPTFFAELLCSRVRMDAEACGPWPELERAATQVIDKVVPRLLAGLRDHEGLPIEPCLIHGDLWDTNVGVVDVDNSAGKVRRLVVFDAGSYYAHNEMELGIWRVVYATMLGRPEYRAAYLHEFPPAMPAAEWDDRNRLYSLKCNLNWSATEPDIITRKIAYNDMCYLCEKYAPLEGIDKYNPQLEPSRIAAQGF